MANEQTVRDYWKVCSKCAQAKPPHRFSRNSASPDGRRPDCTDCQAKRSAAWYEANKTEQQAKRQQYYVANRERLLAQQKAAIAANPEKYRLRARQVRLKRDYGLTLADYERLFQEQGGVCAICKRPEFVAKNLPVDHDHTTGKVRALLCTPCNSVLGLVDELPERLRLMAHYLEVHHR